MQLSAEAGNLEGQAYCDLHRAVCACAKFLASNMLPLLQQLLFIYKALPPHCPEQAVILQ